VPFGQPALSLAAQLQRRAERSGAPADLADLPVGDGDGPEGVSEIGAALFSIVAQSRAAGLDPEMELRAAARSYRDEVQRWAEKQNGDPA
jgi:XTP/dITP diphosphohydrolase